MHLLIADDHDLLRDTLILFLEREAGIEAEPAKDLPAALDRMAVAGPFDLVLLDLDMPGMNGLAGLRTALARAGGGRVALMSGVASRETAEQALTMGAAGFLPKTLPAKSLANAVRFMAMGEQYAPVDFLTAPAAAPPGEAHPLAERLSRRELQVLAGLCAAKSNKEIARELELTEPTVKLHVKTLYRKLGAANRTHAAMIAKEAGLF